MNNIPANLSHERVVSSLPTNPERTETEVTPGNEPDASELLARKYRKSRWEKILFYVVFLGGGGLMWLTAATGVLVAKDVWQSLIWIFPLFVLLAVIVYPLVHFVDFGDVLARLIVAAIVMVALYVCFLLVILSGYADDIWSTVVGNSTMGGLGLAGALGIFGALLSLALTIVLPMLMLALLVKSLAGTELSVLKVVVLTFFTPIGFIFAIGLSIVVNSGF